MDFTEAQRQAITASGNVLVEAGAGAGKTSALINRVLHWLDEPANSVEQLMMVTFTNAAAAELRDRLREGLLDRQRKRQNISHYAEQLALLDTAHISTIHGFCLSLVRENFFALGLDPGVKALDESEATLLAHEVFGRTLARHYEGNSPDSIAIQELLATQANGQEQQLRELILRVHRHTQALENPAHWFREQREQSSAAEPHVWRTWLESELEPWRAGWIVRLEEFEGEAPQVGAALAVLRSLPAKPSVAELGNAVRELAAIRGAWKPRTLVPTRRKMEDLFTEANFFESLCPRESEADPMVEDWQWCRAQMLALLRLTEEFSAAYTAAKKERGALDFPDLEQCALKLLWNADRTGRSPLAETWRQRIAILLVDEYQDINRAQDRIICALARDGSQSNRFLVGDVKQSIYRFRLANPAIFREYGRRWGQGEANSQLVRLNENFRSHARILDVVNMVFSRLMHEEIGGIRYDKHAALHFGAPQARAHLASQPEGGRVVELILHVPPTKAQKQERLENDEEEEGNIACEAILIAQRLLALKNGGFRVYDKTLPEAERWRPLEWRDIVLLLRAPGAKASEFVKQFGRAGIPLDASRAGFYEAEEVRDLRGLLQILDNPLQDIPLIAALRSPFGLLTANDLALVRVALPRGSFWHTLQAFHQREPTAGDKSVSNTTGAWEKVDLFLQRYASWRRIARQQSVYITLQKILTDAAYESWLLTQSNSGQRLANVRLLLDVARQFDSQPLAGVYRFLRLLEAQEDAEMEREPAAAQSTNAVRLMTIHKSKGLEFPVVVIADLGKPFNKKDLSGKVLFHEKFGLCPRVAPPNRGRTYPSVAHWLARRAEEPEQLGEELRLLYVAMTRAEQKLILCGTAREKWFKEWRDGADSGADLPAIASASNYLALLGPLLPALTSRRDWAADGSGQSEFLEWSIQRDVALDDSAAAPPSDSSAIPEQILETLDRRLAWQYPHSSCADQPAKVSVSSLRERLSSREDEEEAVNASRFARSRPAVGELRGAEAGAAYHRFMQHADLQALKTASRAAEVAEDLVRAGTLSPREAKGLDFEALAAFWESDVGVEILRHANEIHRELSFTARFGLDELIREHKLTFAQADGEFIVVQGAVDLAVILPKEIWILDLKTEAVDRANLAAHVEHHQLQLRLYAAALTRIYNRPVARLWIHFLSAGETFDLAGQAASSAGN